MRYESDAGGVRMIAERTEAMGKQEKVFGAYGREKLLTYAESFRELSKSFAQTDVYEGGDRSRILQWRQSRDSQQALCDNLTEVAKILKSVAEETVVCINLPEKVKKRVVRMLAKEKIMVRDIYYIEEHNTDRYLLSVSMHSEKPGGYTARDVGDMLSVLLDVKLSAALSGPGVVDEEERTYLFTETPRFTVLAGYARATKEQEKISGDNYSVLEMDCGKVVVLLSDGMGSGERAGRESGAVIERMETLLEAGHSEASAINIVNNTLLAAGEPVNMSTLDVCSLDLYSGRCEFRKVGAAASFIKSSVFVEPITMNRLPLGIFFRNGDERISRELFGNDYLIMVTDGVLDAFEVGNYEEMLCEYIRDMKECTPSEIAQKILQFALRCSGGRIKDDMTVVVLGIFQGR